MKDHPLFFCPIAARQASIGDVPSDSPNRSISTPAARGSALNAGTTLPHRLDQRVDAELPAAPGAVVDQVLAGPYPVMITVEELVEDESVELRALLVFDHGTLTSDGRISRRCDLFRIPRLPLRFCV